MSWDLDPNFPIYIQLVDRIKMLIISGELSAGGKLDTVRDLAETAGVNPNTMQRALSELERQGLIYSVRTSGRFITDSKELIDNMRDEVAQGKIKDLFEFLKQLGFTKDEMIKLVSQKFNEEGLA